MILSRRSVHLTLIASLAVVGAFLFVYTLVTNGAMRTLLVTSSVGVICSLLVAAQWRGWEPARYIVTLIVAATVVGSLPADELNMAALLPAIFALALVGWRWVAGVGIAVLLVMIAKGNFQGAYIGFTALCAYLPTIGAAVMGGHGAGQSDHR